MAMKHLVVFVLALTLGDGHDTDEVHEHEHKHSKDDVTGCTYGCDRGDCFKYFPITDVVGSHQQNCPPSYNVYHNGKYCCANNEEKVYTPQGEQCDGGPIEFTSLCCKDNAYTECTQPPCSNFIPTGKCSTNIEEKHFCYQVGDKYCVEDNDCTYSDNCALTDSDTDCSYGCDLRLRNCWSSIGGDDGKCSTILDHNYFCSQAADTTCVKDDDCTYSDDCKLTDSGTGCPYGCHLDNACWSLIGGDDGKCYTNSEDNRFCYQSDDSQCDDDSKCTYSNVCAPGCSYGCSVKDGIGKCIKQTVYQGVDCTKSKDWCETSSVCVTHSDCNIDIPCTEECVYGCVDGTCWRQMGRDDKKPDDCSNGGYFCLHKETCTKDADCLSYFQEPCEEVFK